jgi:hypothetical protein
VKESFELPLLSKLQPEEECLIAFFPWVRRKVFDSLSISASLSGAMPLEFALRLPLEISLGLDFAGVRPQFQQEGHSNGKQRFLKADSL